MLPIETVIPQITEALHHGCAAVLEAPPGAGKTTRVPLALLNEPWLKGRKIVMLEPRRLAARAAAAYMAQQLGEEVGQAIGYRVRLDTKVSAATRIELVTEGILTRMLQSDPALENVGLVIFDEFHERSLHADLGLALTLESMSVLRDDLRLLVMSATLDGQAVAALLDGCPLITSQGRSYPVDTRYVGDVNITDVVVRALNEEEGSILAFLPGVAEIRRTETELRQRGIETAPLYGALTREQQEQAIRPAEPGRRKVVLASAIAETSLTIEGVRIVIDSGLMRVARFSPASGMTRLETRPVSRAAADQRRGRAGRIEPGICYRLWSEAQQARLQEHSEPEIMSADLAPLAMQLAAWGVKDPADLKWLDLPSPAAMQQARGLLQRLSILDDELKLTRHGQAVARLPLHPRLAHMIIMARDKALACDIAAVLEERDLLIARDCDLRLRLDLLTALRRREPVDRAQVRYSALQRALKASNDLRRRYQQSGSGEQSPGSVLALAYPDRIGGHRPGSQSRFMLSGGRGVWLPEDDPLGAEDYLVVAELDGQAREARCFLGAAISLSEIEELYGAAVVESEGVELEGQKVVVRRQRRLGSLVLSEQLLKKPKLAASDLVEVVRQAGLAILPWSDSLRLWCRRVEFLRQRGYDLPDLSDGALLESVARWLEPFAECPLGQIDLEAALKSLCSWEQLQLVEREAPERLRVPSGSMIRIDYAAEVPVLAVRLQEMFGLQQTPRLAGQPIVLHLLSPASRPVQITQDLAGFWQSSYHAVKKDLKGRYPKHYWPEDPLEAQPTRRAKPRT